MFESPRKDHRSENIQIINNISFNWDNSCIALATSKGFKIFSTEPLRLKQHRDLGAPLQFVQMFERSNLLSLVGFENSVFKASRVSIFDDNLNNIIADTTFDQNVLSCKIRLNRMVVGLRNRVYVLDFYSLEVQHVIPTYSFSQTEPYNLISLSNDPDNFILACPSLDLGKILLVHLQQERQRHILAHQSNLCVVTVTLNGDKVATTSEKGMNIRIFNTDNGELLQELRRGNEYAQIYSLSFSRGGNWLSCTSDSNNVHVFASICSSQNKQHRFQSVQQQFSNPKSKLYFLRKILPYYDAEYSFCSYSMPDFESELTSVAAFGFHDDNLLLINDYGSFKRIALNLKGGSCKELVEVSELLEVELQPRK